MGAQGTRLIVLHDTADPGARRDAEVFWDLAKRTGGCVLPFNADASGPAARSSVGCCGLRGRRREAAARAAARTARRGGAARTSWTSGAELEKRRVPCVRRFAARLRGPTLSSRHWRICGILVPSSTWSRPAPGLLSPALLIGLSGCASYDPPIRWRSPVGPL